VSDRILRGAQAGHARRVPVPHALRAKLARFDVEFGRAKTLAALGISSGTMADASQPGGTLQPATLAKVSAAVERLERAP
jgi:hypothetical protein